MSTKITVQIETKSARDTLNLELHGEESGDNPAFASDQVKRILDDIALRVRGTYSAYYGEQK